MDECSIPPDFLETLSCLAEPEPSILASCNDVASNKMPCTCQSNHGSTQSHHVWSKRSESTVNQSGLALSCSEAQNADNKPEQFFMCGASSIQCRQSGQLPRGSHGAKVRASDSLQLGPNVTPCGPRNLVKPYRRIPTREFSKVIIPLDAKTAEGRERRIQAAGDKCSGPPRTVVLTRPRSAMPLSFLLNREMIVDACHMECPEEAQVCSAHAFGKILSRIRSDLIMQKCAGDQACE